jgi:type I restriction enzyme, R subunit
VVTELPCENGEDNFRPDIIFLVNGMPLAFMEAKRQNNREGIMAERDRMHERFRNSAFRRFVNITQLMLFSNDQEYDDTDRKPIQGSYYACSAYGKVKFNHFREQRPAGDCRLCWPS